ncbi:MAG: VWA domain-containing protein [Myxococcota bacterium]|nr:VWA domain-containing protein [Myxococcota bacterium]
MRSLSLLSLLVTLSGCGVLFQVHAPTRVPANVQVATDKPDEPGEVAVASPFVDVEGGVEVEASAELHASARVSIEGSGTSADASAIFGDMTIGVEGVAVGAVGVRGEVGVGVEGAASGASREGAVVDTFGSETYVVGGASAGAHGSFGASTGVGVGASGASTGVGVDASGASTGVGVDASGASTGVGLGARGTSGDVGVGASGDVIVDDATASEVEGRAVDPAAPGGAVVIEPGVRAAGGLDVEVDGALRGDPGAAPEALGGGAGVRAAPPIGGGRAAVRTSLGALATEAGVNVDGYRTRLGDLGPLAPLALEAEARAGVSLETDGRVDVRAELAHAQLPRAGGETDLVVRVRGGDAPASARGRVRVHLVIDRSSSMRASWGDVLASASAVVDQLGADDELHVVAYDANATVVVPLGRVGDGASAKRAIRQLSVGGGTNIEVGLRAAYDAVLRAPGDVAPLVVLLSDGVPNGGAFTADELAPMAANASARVGCTTTVVGLGNEFDADVLQAIATAGGGGYHVAANVGDLSEVLRAEVRAQLRVAARAVEVGVDLPEGVELLDAPESVVRVSAGVRLRMPQLRERAERRVVLRVRVRGGASSVANVLVRYRSSAGPDVVASKDVGVSFGARAVVSGGAAVLAVADAQLGEALELSARHLRDGRVDDAKRALEAHAQVYARTPHVELRHRTDAVGRFAVALGALAPDASWSARREVSLMMGGMAIRLRR